MIITFFYEKYCTSWLKSLSILPYYFDQLKSITHILDVNPRYNPNKILIKNPLYLSQKQCLIYSEINYRLDMKKIRIVKTVDGIEKENYTIPLFFVNLLSKILPSSGIEGMQEKGLDISALIEAAKNQQDYKTKLTVIEGKDKTIIDLSLEP